MAQKSPGDSKAADMKKSSGKVDTAENLLPKEVSRPEQAQKQEADVKIIVEDSSKAIQEIEAATTSAKKYPEGKYTIQLVTYKKQKYVDEQIDHLSGPTNCRREDEISFDKT